MTLIDINALAEYLDVSVPFIRKLIRTEEIPYYRIGNRLKFNKIEIEAWLNMYKKTNNGIIAL